MNDLSFSPLDRYFSELLAARSGLAGAAKERFQELVARVSKALEDGHSCLPLGQGEEQFLAANPLVSDGGRTPLVLHNHRLYLHRYFHYETRLAEQIRLMAAITLRSELDRIYGRRIFRGPGNRHQLAEGGGEGRASSGLNDHLRWAGDRQNNDDSEDSRPAAGDGRGPASPVGGPCRTHRQSGDAPE